MRQKDMSSIMNNLRASRKEFMGNAIYRFSLGDTKCHSLEILGGPISHLEDHLSMEYDW